MQPWKCNLSVVMLKMAPEFPAFINCHIDLNVQRSYLSSCEEEEEATKAQHPPSTCQLRADFPALEASSCLFRRKPYGFQWCLWDMDFWQPSVAFGSFPTLEHHWGYVLCTHVYATGILCAQTCVTLGLCVCRCVCHWSHVYAETCATGVRTQRHVLHWVYVCVNMCATGSSAHDSSADECVPPVLCVDRDTCVFHWGCVCAEMCAMGHVCPVV